MSSAEFAEWQAYQRLAGPLGPERDDWRVALIASVIANANRDAKRRPRAYQPHEFVPDWAAAAGVGKPAPHPLDVAEKVKAFFRNRGRRK